MAKKILVIDDDRLIRESVAKILQKEGYDSVLAGGAEEALKIAGESSIDLVISDIRMPGTNGVETIREMRKLFSERIAKDIPIIFITCLSACRGRL